MTGDPEATWRREGYWLKSQSPLQALIFLLPLIVAYDLSLMLLGTEKVRQVLQMQRPVGDIKARRMLFDFFEWFGISGYYLPGLAVVIVLLAWHQVRRDRWSFEPRLYLMMWVESILLSLPLFVFGMVVKRLSLQALVAPEPDGFGGASTAIALSIGAGIYEELLFRLIGLALLHFVLADWLKAPEPWGAGLSIGLTALAFAAYHFTGPELSSLVRFEDRQVWGRCLFYFAAGVYFAFVYLARGFGIVVWTHAIYDVLVFVLRMQNDFEGS
ncbi:MAG: hypothetical protein CMJ18_15715 [Phycisphaeraceae bacterium]|nr:hypothetical protein [Phycisphaeraceae bacterium]